jgi:hypothetical protein
MGKKVVSSGTSVTSWAGNILVRAILKVQHVMLIKCEKFGAFLS